jgi:uroporphyrin-III C-methyltransferase
MGKSAAGEVASHLIAAGLPVDTPVALVENASLPEERQFHTSLGLLPLTAKAALGNGPALLLIGAAMAKPPLTESTCPAAVGAAMA